MILGMIPARGGSKGVYRKNVRCVAGKPLIAWTIEAAKSSVLLDDFVVSTEDSDIAATVEKLGARTVMRPLHLATDETSTLAVMQHILNKEPADILVLLQATSPIRETGLIDKCIQQFLDTGADSLATGFNCHYTEYGSNHLRRQDIPGFFYDDGNVYVIRGDLIKNGDRYGKRIERVLLDREQNVEIDDEYDLWLAEKILEHPNDKRPQQ